MSIKGVLSVKNRFSGSSGVRLKVILKLPVPVDYILLPDMSINFPFYSEGTSLVLSIDHNYAPGEKYHLAAQGNSYCFPNEKGQECPAKQTFDAREVGNSTRGPASKIA